MYEYISLITKAIVQFVFLLLEICKTMHLNCILAFFSDGSRIKVQRIPPTSNNVRAQSGHRTGRPAGVR